VDLTGFRPIEAKLASAVIFFLLAAIPAHSGTDPKTSINEGLMAYYTFDDGGHDSSPYHRDLTLGSIRIGTGAIGQGASLRAPNAFLKLDTLGFPRNSESFSVSGWIKMDSFGPASTSRGLAFAGVSVVRGSGLIQFAFAIDAQGNPAFGTGAGTTGVPVGTVKALRLGRWNHVSVTYDGSSKMIRIYLDGVEAQAARIDKVGNLAVSGPWHPVFPANLDAEYQNPDPSGRLILNGDVDQVVLHDRALTPEEVRFLADRGLLAPPDYVVKFAPQLRFTKDSARWGYPMSAQTFFNALPKDANGVPIRTHGGGSVGVENNNFSTLRDGSIPTYFQERFIGDQVRINYWWFSGYQHECIPVLAPQSAHNGDWEHVTVILKEDRSGIAAVSYYQHNGHYTRIAGIHGPCSPAGTGRCDGSGGFDLDATHPIVYVGRIAHGNYHNTNRYLPGRDPNQPDPTECTYYGDIRDPRNSDDYLDSSRNLIDLDWNREPWIAKDRAPANWIWGPDESYVSTHPTQKPPDDSEHRVACEGAPTFLFASDGCYKSECIAGDDEASEDCLKECKPGYTNVGLTCNKGTWPWEWSVYGRLTGGNKYSYPYTLPRTDIGLTRRRETDQQWSDLP